MKRKITLTLLLIIASACLILGFTACSQSSKDSYDYLVTFNYNTASLDLEGDFSDQYLGVKAGSRIMQPCKPDSEQYNTSDFKEKQISLYEVQSWYVAKYDEDGNVLKDEQGMAVVDRTWNFTKDTVNSNITLYAKLVVKHSIRLMDDGELFGEKKFAVGKRVYDTSFYGTDPEKDGYTFCGYYSDPELKTPFLFPYRMGEEDITLYVKFIEGENWSVVSTAQDFNKEYTASAKIYLEADIDFTGVEWKSGQEFNGEINGNNYKLKNITCSLKSTVKELSNFGLFGVLNSTSYVHDVTFENVNVTVSTTTSVPIQAALFAWSIKDGAKLENVTVSGTVSKGTVYENSDISLSKVCCIGSSESENIKNCDFSAIILNEDIKGENQ